MSAVTVDPNKKSREQGKKDERGWETMEEVEKKRPIISARERGQFEKCVCLCVCVCLHPHGLYYS